MIEARKILSSNIKAERVRNDLSQEEVAKKLNISRETYIKYERGYKIDAVILYELSNVFNCKIDSFYLNFGVTKCED